MSYVWLTLGWLFAILFGLLTVSMLMLNNWLHALVLLLAVPLCLPPVSSLMQNQFGWSIHPVLHGVLIVALLFVFGWLLLGQKATSILASFCCETSPL